tara:strand:+ start:323 stop:664 length:342 start_codon:yes stop_codon:yes gene_type:complete
MPKPIKLFKKRKARKIHKSRTPHYVKGQKPGTTSTVLMVSNIIDDNTKLPRKTGPYNVWPSITTDKERPYKQSFDEAKKAGEMFQFKNLKKAQKFEKGSWKKRMGKGGIIQHD